MAMATEQVPPIIELSLEEGAVQMSVLAQYDLRHNLWVEVCEENIMYLAREVNRKAKESFRPHMKMIKGRGLWEAEAFTQDINL